MRESKTELFRIRLTPTEKKLLEEYAEKRNLSMSEAIRELCKKIFYQEEK